MNQDGLGRAFTFTLETGPWVNNQKKAWLRRGHFLRMKQAEQSPKWEEVRSMTIDDDFLLHFSTSHKCFAVGINSTHQSLV